MSPVAVRIDNIDKRQFAVKLKAFAAAGGLVHTNRTATSGSWVLFVVHRRRTDHS
jgi:hypothetical protein